MYIYTAGGMHSPAASELDGALQYRVLPRRAPAVRRDVVDQAEAVKVLARVLEGGSDSHLQTRASG